MSFFNSYQYFIDNIPLPRAKGTVRQTYGEDHPHILDLRAGYVHHRLPAWNEVDDRCHERQITVPVAPCKPM